MANPVLKVQEFAVEVWTELKKCSWPTRKELVDSTLVVIVTIVVLGIFVAIADLIFLRIVALLTRS
ncbi:MAG TPA: preprotein translocase subunit SecE [Verrucomicrobiae bacterium]|nr:preprotein translocase subunit SecE [Verrucomicrobiae bacterium]